MKRNTLLSLVGAFTLFVPTVLLFLGLNMLFFVPLGVGLVALLIGLCRSSPETHRRYSSIGIAACLLATIGPFLIAAYANRTGNPIRVVLPEGFTGEFSIVRDRQQGVDVERENGVWVYRIPDSGELRVTNDSAFFMCHPPTVFIDSAGNSIIVESQGTSGGTIRTGPNSTRGSTDYDGTTHRWRVQTGR